MDVEKTQSIHVRREHETRTDCRDSMAHVRINNKHLTLRQTEHVCCLTKVEQQTVIR